MASVGIDQPSLVACSKLGAFFESAAARGARDRERRARMQAKGRSPLGREAPQSTGSILVVAAAGGHQTDLLAAELDLEFITRLEIQ